MSVVMVGTLVPMAGIPSVVALLGCGVATTNSPWLPTAYFDYDSSFASPPTMAAWDVVVASWWVGGAGSFLGMLQKTCVAYLIEYQ